MFVIRKILDWLKYERLHHYPALAVFDREAALKRLQAYEREEQEASQPWLRVSLVVIAISLGLWMAISYITGGLRGWWFLLVVPGCVQRYVLHRRIKRRVEAKVAAELRDGRLWRCLECGYDLRVSEERCPECGAPVRVAPR